MTMGATRKIAAGEFKAKCLALLDEVAQYGEVLVITKRGRPLARVLPFVEPKQSLRGSILREKDLVSPIGEDWNVEE